MKGGEASPAGFIVTPMFYGGVTSDQSPSPSVSSKSRSGVHLKSRLSGNWGQVCWLLKCSGPFNSVRGWCLTAAASPGSL